MDMQDGEQAEIFSPACAAGRVLGEREAVL